MSDEDDLTQKVKRLADRMSANGLFQQGEGFGGAFILIPPSGNIVDGVILGPPDPAMFWSMVKGKIDIAMAELQAEEEQRRGLRAGFGMR